MNKLLVLAGCMVAVSAAPRPDGPPVYGPKPVAPYKEPEVFPPQPYEYKYGVADDYSKIQGSYKIALPDGRIQIVSYVSDENGYQADVTYEGEPVYPAPPPGGYGPYKGPGAYPGPKPGGYN